MSRFRLSHLALACLSTSACVDRHSGPERLVVRDSAGVSIVTNAAPLNPEPVELQIGSPVAEFGRGPTEYDYFERVTGATRTRDGRLFVLEFGARELREYAAGGAFDRVLGGRGQGPGEFVFPSDLRRVSGDSVEVWDRRQGRLYTFTPGGDLARERSFVEPSRPPPIHVQRLSPSSWVGAWASYDQVHSLVQTVDVELVQMPVVLVALDSVGRALDTVALHPGARFLELPRGSMTGVFSRSTPWTAADGRLAFGDGSTPEFHVVGASGDTLQIVRWQAERHLLDRDVIVALANSIGATRQIDITLAPAFLPDTLPAYRRLEFFGDQIWIGNATPFDLGSDRWEVFSAAGQWLHTVRLRPQSDILDVANGHAVVSETDGLGVQTLAVYRLPF